MFDPIEVEREGGKKKTYSVPRSMTTKKKRRRPGEEGLAGEGIRLGVKFAHGLLEEQTRESVKKVSLPFATRTV